MADEPSREKILQWFGERVRSERKTQGLSQEELAHRAQLDRSYVGGVERGERNLTLVNIVALATALDVTPSTLLEPIAESRE